jgi:predicted acetyltransferase
VAALSARKYSQPGSVVFKVHDSLGLAAGTWRLEVDAGQGMCKPTRSSPDIELDIEDLGACYLGWARFRALARAGRMSGSPSALSLVDGMFGWNCLPWCPEML